MTENQPTLLACLTPPGQGAIATLAVRGPRAWSVTRELFQQHRGGRLAEEPTPGQFRLGWLGDRAKGGADEVVLLIKQTQPYPWLEVHCHGGIEVVRLMQELFEGHGVTTVDWPDFERQRAPVWQIAAQEALVAAPTVKTAAIALDQWHGAFVQAIAQCTESWQNGGRDAAKRRLERLHALVGVGRHLVQPWRVVLAGAPNVGKSSLSNALTGYARSVVAPTPGTTRNVVTTTIALDGWPIELADTAGLRDSNDALEQEGTSRAQAVIASADLCLWMVDGSAAPSQPIESPERCLYVINKIDLPPAWNWETIPGASRVSAKMMTGLTELCQQIVERLVPTAPEPGEAVPYTEELCVAVAAIVMAFDRNDDEVSAQLATLCEKFHREIQ